MQLQCAADDGSMEGLRLSAAGPRAAVGLVVVIMVVMPGTAVQGPRGVWKIAGPAFAY